jgi:hypothetical protein
VKRSAQLIAVLSFGGSAAKGLELMRVLRPSSPQAVRSQLYDNIVLWSCRINGEPGVAIVMVDYPGENKLAVMPLFVAITPGMELAFEDEQSASGSGCGRRRTTRQEFAFNRETMTCLPAG